MTRFVEKQSFRLPFEIQEALRKWMRTAEEVGIYKMRETGGKGLHDEPLKGKLKGLRSVRLNKAWRLYYSEDDHSEVIILKIEKVDKHKY